MYLYISVNMYINKYVNLSNSAHVTQILKSRIPSSKIGNIKIWDSGVTATIIKVLDRPSIKDWRVYESMSIN